MADVSMNRRASGVRRVVGYVLGLFIQTHKDGAEQCLIDFHAISDSLADRQGFTQKIFGAGGVHSVFLHQIFFVTAQSIFFYPQPVFTTASDDLVRTRT